MRASSNDLPEPLDPTISRRVYGLLQNREIRRKNTKQTSRRITTKIIIVDAVRPKKRPYSIFPPLLLNPSGQPAFYNRNYAGGKSNQDENQKHRIGSDKLNEVAKPCDERSKKCWKITQKSCQCARLLSHKITSKYNLYETGKRDFIKKHLKALCLYYHVFADYILGLSKGLDWPRWGKV